MNLLIIENLYKDFSGLKVLNGVDFQIEDGQKHAIIGPNGAGKTTLFNIITGKHKPSHGIIVFNGDEITGLPPYKIVYKGIARSFQIINIFQSMSVFENIRNAIISKMKSRFNMTSWLELNKKVTEKTEEMLEVMSLRHRGNTPVSSLSYGEQREIEIALTLALDPKLILLDEPTAGLNKLETLRMIDLVRRVTQNKTVVIIEHDMNVVFELADRITVLYYGKVLAVGTPQEIRASEEVRKAYLGTKDYAIRS